ncbi:ATP-binding protein [Bacillus sp. AFS076308]|uniref:Dph6-related ATP pyrophosphatase n=1 Tax=unclassified Bacillus (in: firmicutes) TaxID=185979 RepID=UPI000BF696DE|nr:MULTISPECIES: diphthine--ammonia ligase [unclassified Bacillus (in: firmicutes)]PFN97737.1 ATP-binding protein [Bacillus sp. AFS076308]PGV51073.1 ATP-binding protein [Bacillus sp. AFS037270]
MKKVAVSFSGKDSTLALHDLLNSNEYEVKLLFSTVTDGFNRTSIHGVREELLEAQAKSIGLPLKKIRIPEQCSNDKYGEIMIKEINAIKKLGVDHFAFGDLFLEDVRRYREEMLKPSGITPIFPLWGINTAELIHRFISLGYRTITTCVDLTQLPESFSGREITKQFIEDLPGEVDPCGENGEFHSFVFEGPIFKEPIRFKLGEKKFTNDIYTDQIRFCYTDLIPSKE